MIVFAMILTGCQEVQDNVESRNEDLQKIESEGRVGDTTLTGTIVVAGDTTYLVKLDGGRTQLDSYAYDLKEYANMQVVITGQYSGDTLFVGKLEK